MTTQDLDNLRIELSVKAKNGVDFITSATIIWLLISMIWTFSFSAYNKSVFSLIVGGVMLPLALGFSKVYKTQWKIETNPLQPLGIILNLAQLFYFPFLVLCLLKFPNYFILAYAVITGAHFFPYAWFYKERAYGIVAGLISIGSLVIGLVVSTEYTYLIPAYTAICLIILGSVLFHSYKRRGSLQANVV